MSVNAKSVDSGNLSVVSNDTAGRDVRERKVHGQQQLVDGSVE